MWVTDWDDPGSTFTPALFGRPALFGHLRATRSAGRWRKLEAVLAWLESHPQVRRAVWADDHLAGEDHPGRTRAAVVAADLRTAGVDALLVCPDPDTGLTPEHLQRMAQHLA